MSDVSTIPDGFTRHTRTSGLTQPWEPIYAARENATFSLGLYAAMAHVNSRGLVHGGMLCALADNAMGLSCAQQLDGRTGLLTISINMDYLGSGQLGDWIEIRAQPSKLGKSICFAQAQVFANNQLCATARAVFKPVAMPTEKEQTT